MKNMNQFENEQEFGQDDLSATELTAGPDNLLDDDLEGEDTGAIDTDYATESLDSDDDELLDSDDELSDADVGGANADLGGTESSTGDSMDDDLNQSEDVGAARGDTTDYDPDFTGRDDS